MPYSDFADSAKVLDGKRLGKQRIESLQILSTLLHTSSLGRDWSNHPAVVMWRGYEGMLFQYGMTICKEWTSRGYQDGVSIRLQELVTDAFFNGKMERRLSLKPYWLGIEGFHLSHRSNLVRKDPNHYRKFWPEVSDELEYVWPRFREDLQGPWTPRDKVDDRETRSDLASLESSLGPPE